MAGIVNGPDNLSSPPLVGGDEGEGEISIFTLTPCLPAGRQPSPVKGEGIYFGGV